MTRRMVLTAAALAATGVATAGVAGCTPGADDVTDEEVADAVRRFGAAVTAQDAVALETVLVGTAADRIRGTLLTMPFERASAGFVATVLLRSSGTVAVEVTWRLTGESRGSLHTVAAVPVRTAAGTAALSIDRPEADPDDTRTVLSFVPPIWWVDSLDAVAEDDVVVLRSVTDGRSTAEWTALASTARRRAAAGTGRGGPLVVVVPSSPQVLTQVLGRSPTGDDTRAAFAWSGGGVDGPVHIYLDPVTAAAAGEASLSPLLAHEAVHVLTDAPRTELPLWVEEGYADAIAFATDDDLAWRSAGALTVALRDGGEVAMLPDDAAFVDGGTGQALAYATAWSVCRWLVELVGADGLRGWYDRQAPPDGTPGVAEPVAWNAVAPVPAADREPAWRDWLSRAAR